MMNKLKLKKKFHKKNSEVRVRENGRKNERGRMRSKTYKMGRRKHFDEL